MKRNVRLKRIATIVLVIIFVFQINPIDAENDSDEWNTVHSDWWRPDFVLAVSEHTFSGIGDSVLLPYLLGLNGIYGPIEQTETDSDAVVLGDDLYLTAVDYFDRATLTVTVGGKTYSFILHNPGKETVIPAGTEVTGESGSFTATGEIPAGTELTVGAFEPTEKLKAAVPADDEKTVTVWMEIGLQSPDGEAVHSGADVSVKTHIELPAAPERNGLAGHAVIRQARLYHVIGEDTVEELPVEVETEDGYISMLRFSTESFSGFALSYTVDFEYEIDGETYEYSLPGGGVITLKDLLALLGILSEDEEGDPDQFIADIQNVAFSDPSLVWVCKVEEDSTVGQIKDAHGLACEYSAELSAKQIEEMNSVTISAGEWILICLKAFDTEERLTITLANGEKLVVKVTDWHIEKEYLSADGITYRIEVTLDERDAIEGEAELKVEELLEDAANYEDYLMAVSESMELDSVEEIQFVRFFDIKILVDGQAFEPVYPAQVRISYQDAIELDENQEVRIVHFADSGTEVIQAVEVSEDRKVLTYEQTGFSVSATVVAANNLQDGQQYVIYTKSGNNYYAISHYSEGRDADIVYGAQVNASTTTGASIHISDYGSSIVWTAHKETVGKDTYWTFSYEEDGKTYYLRSYGGLMVGADSDIDESGYRESQRYQWSISNNQLRARYTNDKTRRLRYSDNARAFRERDNDGYSTFYFARAENYTQDVPETPKIHYVDENGSELTVLNGRDWSDTRTSPAFLIYDIDGYEYEKTTLASVNGTEIRPILRESAGKWQYTTSVVESRTIDWVNIPSDGEEQDRLEDIYVVYKKAAEPVAGGTPKVKPVQGTEKPAEPSITKASTVNGNGTNTLSISVTGHTAPMEVEKLADVIVIFDTSSSMTRAMGTDNRLGVAKTAVNNLAETLIGKNTQFQDSEKHKLIRMSLISFNKSASVKCDFTDDPSKFKAAVNGLTTDTGTNWEAALDLANHLSVDPERATFVIFVTDGNPSYRISRGNMLSLEGYPEKVNDTNLDVNTANNYYFYRVLEYFGALDENDERNFNTAAVIAKSIVDHSKNLYCIGIGNSAGITRLEGLTALAYGGNTAIGAERTKTADNEEELAQAFSDIAASIVALMGHSDIQIADGITSLTQTVQKSSLVSFAEDDFTYYKGKVVVATQSDVNAGRAAKVGDPIPATQADVDAGLAETVGGTKVESWQPWDPTTEHCAEAVYNTDTDAVEWNMGDRFMLEEGYTYQLRFNVWPSQEAYDLLADLNNGVKTYDSLSEAEKAQIKEPATAGGMYTLKTNSETSYTYREATKTGDTVTPMGDPSEPGSFPDVDPLELTTKPLKVKKQWHNNYVDSRTLADQITMELYGVDPDGVTSHDFKTITLTKNEGWYAENNYISYGLVTYNTTTNADAKIYETGHDFTLRETDDEAHYYELTAGVYRPMVINGTPTILERDDAAPAGMGNDVFHYTDGSHHYYRLDGKVYRDTQSDILLIATNTHRSYMDLNKVVVDPSGNAAVDHSEFEYTVTFTVPSGIANYDSEKYIWFSVYDSEAHRPLSPDEYTCTNAQNPRDVDEAYSGTEYANYLVATSGQPFTLKIKQGWNVRFLNLPIGTTYSFEETNIVSGYDFVKAEVSGTQWIANMVNGEDKGSEQVMSSLPSNSSGDNSDTGISGTIGTANARYRTTYTNRTLTASATISGKKVLEGRELLEDDRFTFKLEPAGSVTGKYPGLPDGNVLTTQNNEVGVFGFTLNYTAADFQKYKNDQGVATFTYRVTEQPPEGVSPGGVDPETSIRYSEQQYWVQVDVEYVGEGLQVTKQRIYTENPLRTTYTTKAEMTNHFLRR